MLRSCHYPGKRLPRPAYTLIEMLVVIGIIILVLSLSVGAYWTVAGSSQTKATQANLIKLRTLTDRKWQAVIDQANKETIPSDLKAHLQLSTSTDETRLRVVWIKMRLKQAFPQTFAEVFNPFNFAVLFTGPPTMPAALQTRVNNLFAPNRNYVTTLNRAGVNAGNANTVLPLAQQSAICLLLALQSDESGTSISAQDIGDATISPIQLANGQSLPGLVDAWGTPLAFCRWPVRYDERKIPPALGPGEPPNGQFTNVVQTDRNPFKDPGDPQGYLPAPTWSTNPTVSAVLRAWFQTNIHQLPNPGQTYLIRRETGRNSQQYVRVALQPIVVSAGADRLLGLNPVNFQVINVAATDWQDNLTSLRDE